MDLTSCPSIPALFHHQAEQLAGRPFLWSKSDGRYRPLTWQQVSEAVRKVAAGLARSGVGRGDRVMLVSENRPEWLIADMAVMSLGAVTVPAYTTNTVGDHRHILNDCTAKVVIASTQALTRTMVSAARQAQHTPIVVSMEPPQDLPQDLKESAPLPVVSWDELLGNGATAPPPIPPDLGRDDLACLIYTSGTGGAPKGVMLSHGNILHNCLSAYHLLMTIGLGREVFLSFLPLSHSYEHTAGQFFPIAIGAEIYYAESLDRLSANLIEVRPTIMTAVPRLYEVLRARILHGVQRAGGLKEKMFHDAVALGRKRLESPHDMTLLERLYDAVLERLVRRKIAQRFGGRLKAMVSGGAPLNTEVGLFFAALGVPLLQGYGQTESSPVISCNRPGKVKMHTVGPPLHGVEVKIAEDGEILVRGGLVMKGYWNNEDATRQAIDKDGWLHTGDVGRIDEDGYIEITDRKKDIIVNSGGDNISPQKVEGFLTMTPEIAQAMVYGDKRPHLVALLVPDPDFAAAWTKGRGLDTDLASLCDDADFRKTISGVVERVNQNLPLIERVRRFHLVPEAFSVDNGMMTPTLKIRRHIIRERYRDRLETLYEPRK